MRRKTEYLNLRILPSIKEALRFLATKEHRSIAGTIEFLVMEQCKAKGINVEKFVAKKTAGLRRPRPRRRSKPGDGKSQG